MHILLKFSLDQQKLCLNTKNSLDKPIKNTTVTCQTQSLKNCYDLSSLVNLQEHI